MSTEYSQPTHTKLCRLNTVNQHGPPSVDGVQSTNTDQHLSTEYSQPTQTNVGLSLCWSIALLPLVYLRVGLSPCWSVAVLICCHVSLPPCKSFSCWFFSVLACRRVGLSPFWYVAATVFSLSSFCAQRQCCNLQSVYIRSLQFIFSDLRLLVFERIRTSDSQQAQNPLCTF